MERFYFVCAIFVLYGVLSYYFRQSDDYDSLIQIRKVFRLIFPCILILFVLAVFPSILGQGVSSIFVFIGLSLLFSPLIVILYYICMWRWGIRDYYDEEHIDNMEYFTLYLRSFKDDQSSRTNSRRIIALFYKMFCPFAVGRPYELLPPKIGAPRLYLADHWKENVLLLMEKAQIILLRISDTENFIWEYEQVIENNYLPKTVFWIKDHKSLYSFISGLQSRHSLIWNDLKNTPIEKETLAYIYDNEWMYYSRDNYSSFCPNYLQHRPIIAHDYNNYLYDSGRVYKHMIKFRTDSNVMPEIPKWDWYAFALPELFFLLHRIEKVGPLLIFCLLDIRLIVSTFDFFAKPSTITCVSLLFWISLRVLTMYFLGRNSRTVVWLSEKWESVGYYNRIYKENNRKVAVLAIAVFAGALILSLFGKQ